mgnify:CR=1 FL=1
MIVDSVRNYHTDADDRGRIDIIDKLAKKGVEFTTAVTSAPSTVMSTSAMMTSVPAIYQSLIYEGFNSKTRSLNTLQSILHKNGYNVLNTIFFPEGRAYLAPMIGDICERYWPDHLDTNKFWSNDNINEILEALLHEGLADPFFLYLNYNCRHDPKTSQKVEHGLKMLEEKGLLENTIIVINSDHGYPDPSRNISYTQMRDLGHDLIMTDDNILAPLVFVAPNITPKVIKEPVSLLDISPTILDIVGINDGELKNENEMGKSLKSLIFEENLSPKNQIQRVDNRYIAQNNRLSALRDNRYKYIFDFDNNKEFFYDIKKDRLELKDLIDDEKKTYEINRFRAVFKSEELKILNHHLSFIKKRMIETIGKEAKKIALVQINNNKILDLSKRAAKELNMEINNVVSDLRLTNEGRTEIFDICILILEGKNPRIHSLQYNLSKQIKSKKILIFNENFTEVSAPKSWVITSAEKFFKVLLPKLFTSPKAFFTDSLNALKRLWKLKK